MNVNKSRPRLEVHLRFFESRVQLIYPDGVEGIRNFEALLSGSRVASRRERKLDRSWVV